MKKKLWRGIFACGIAGVGLLIWLLDIGSWTQLDMDKLTNLSQTTMIYDAHGEQVAGVHNGQNRVMVSINEVPEHVKNAFVAMEDARFYQHSGVDIWRIGGAILSNIKAGGYQEGASTITQQLIKLTHLTSEKKLSRKAQEAWLAIQLEKQVEKNEILEMYLNTVYFGNGAYGIEAAAQTYFGKSCSELTLSEGALLAGVIKAPGKYAPHIDLDKAIRRRSLVLDAMVREEMISEEAGEQAKKEQVVLNETSESSGEGWYVDWTLREAAELMNVSVEELLSGGYRIYCALESEMQSECERLFTQAEYFPDAAEDGVKPESALIALNPDTGEILCMMGGRSYDMRLGLNRAMQIQRQPGSAFKPISVYAAAIDYLGYTPVSLIQDEARDFGGGYIPSNSSGNAYGTVTLREALKRSMNLATVDLISRTGIQAAMTYAERAGIDLSDTDNNLSLALGSLTNGVSPADMCAAYAPLANGGTSVEPHTVCRIEDLYGRELYRYGGEKRYVMSDKSARMLTSILEDAAASGTARAVGNVGFPVAAKTGTVGQTDGGNRDVWTVAYTPKVAVAVWQGYDQPDAMHMLPAGTTGGTYPARLAAAFLKNTEDYSNGGEFPIPAGMSEALLDGSVLSKEGGVVLASERTPKTYLLSEILPDEKLPVLTSERWNDPKRVEAIYVQANAEGNPEISFVSPDSGAQYLIMRMEGEEQIEVGCIEGNAGSYLSFTDQTESRNAITRYCVISRHKAFYEEGIVVLSEPSETVEFRAPSLLERMVLGQENTEENSRNALFDVASE